MASANLPYKKRCLTEAEKATNLTTIPSSHQECQKDRDQIQSQIVHVKEAIRDLTLRLERVERYLSGENEQSSEEY